MRGLVVLWSLTAIRLRSVSGAGSRIFGLVLVSSDFVVMLPSSAVPGLYFVPCVSSCHKVWKIYETYSALYAANPQDCVPKRQKQGKWECKLKQNVDGAKEVKRK